MRLSEILHRRNKSTKRDRARPMLDLHSGKNLTQLARAVTKDSRAKHSRYLNWSRPCLSKIRYMAGRQCAKKLWQTVYDPEPAEEPLPGTVIGTGIEVGIKARLLWHGGVLVDTIHDYREAISRLAPQRLPVPLFVLGFIAMMLFNSVHLIPQADKVYLVQATTFLLTVALAAMGLETDFGKLRAKGWRPLLVGAGSWIFISAFSLVLIELAYA